MKQAHKALRVQQVRKALSAAMGYCDNYVRLPLTVMEAAHEQTLLALMREQGLIK